jgi:FixJ family two-component response regulator
MRKVSSANSCETRVVYIVDEDGAVREALFRLMLSAGFEARVFSTLEQFLAEVEPSVGCMLLDMPRPRPAPGLPSACANPESTCR